MLLDQLSESANDTEKRKQTLLVAIILLRFVRSDGQSKMLELLHMSEILRKDFSLSQSELEEVFKHAKQGDENGVSTAEILAKVREQWSLRSRSKLLEYLWVLAFADDKIDDKEAEFIETLGAELGLSRLDQARSQEKAEAHLGL
jgi:uncharacterized tellurite resistance protein B-like protein